MLFAKIVLIAVIVTVVVVGLIVRYKRWRAKRTGRPLFRWPWRRSN